jgi:hypothetical protein
MSKVVFSASSFTRKPWGAEYLVAKTISSALWCLDLKQGSSTSFHCHPLKRTGYVVLLGNVLIEFLSGTRILGAGEFINFRPGLFHKTTALSPRTIVLEIESPDCKSDLLRLEDLAGRSSSIIEVPESHPDASHYCLIDSFDSIFNKGITTNIFNLTVSLQSLINLRSLERMNLANSFLMVMEGVSYTNERYPLGEPQRLLGPGDVISLKNLLRMRDVIDMSSASITGVSFESLG